MNALPIGVFWLLAIWGFTGRPERLLYLFFCTMPFGSFAVIPTELTAGLTFTPTPIVALIIIFRQLVNRRGLDYTIGMALNHRRLLLLFLFWIVAAIVTIFMPRLFAEQVAVIPMNLLASTYGEPLRPTTQNISQLAYMTISIGTVFAFARMLRNPVMRQHAVNALVAGGILVVFTGLLDYATQFASISGLLEPFRTATYALLTEVTIGGGKRVVGLMPEASAYGAIAVVFLSAIYFFRRSLAAGFTRDRVIPLLLPMLLLMIWLSTSSSAYVALAVFCFVAGLEWLWRAFLLAPNNRRRRGLAAEFWVLAAIGVAGCLVLLFFPHLLDPIVDMVDLLIFKKTSTSSFEERSMWTAVSWQALLNTYGLGVGLGGTRSSNGVVSMFSNTGFLGGVLYYSFVLQTFLRRAPRHDKAAEAMSAAIFWSFLPPFVAVILAGTTPDFGVFNGFLFGLALSIEQTARRTLSLPGDNILPDESAEVEGRIRN